MPDAARLSARGPAWFSALGLDAAAIGLVWAVALWPQPWTARAAERWTLFALAIALAYTADRWIDARRAPGSARLPPRQAPHRRHPCRVATGWLAALGAGLALAATTLTPAEWLGCLVLTGLAATYPFVPESDGLPIKPLLVGLLFAGGVAILAPGPGGLATETTVYAFGLVCAANAACVARLDAGRAGRSPDEPAGPGRHLDWVLAGCAAGVALTAFVQADFPAQRLRALGLLVAALGLLWMGRRARPDRIGPDRWLGALGSLVAAGILFSFHAG